MSTQTKPRVLAGVPAAGEFAVTARPDNGVALTEAFASDQLVAEFAAIDFDLADSTARFRQVALDPARPIDERRTAARAAIERADDYVLHARHALSDDGSGVASLAVECAEDDVVLDAALSVYATEELEDGDEHLFGIDLAAIVYQCDQASGADRWGRRYAAETRVTGHQLDAYDADDPKAIDRSRAYHHNDGSKPDHEAKPGKAASRKTASPHSKGQRAGREDAAAGTPRKDLPERDENGDPSYRAGYINSYNQWVYQNADTDDPRTLKASRHTAAVRPLSGFAQGAGADWKLDAYDAGDPKAIDLEAVFERADLARA